MRSVWSVVLVVVLPGTLNCTGNLSHYDRLYAEDAVTVLVRNSGPAPRRIYADYGGVRLPLGEVSPGTAVCLRLPVGAAGSYRLLARELGGRVTASLPFNTQTYRAWEWTVSTGGASDLLSLEPAGQSCVG